jgi:hypothetical protein
MIRLIKRFLPGGVVEGSPTSTPPLNRISTNGLWRATGEKGGIVHRFHARDLHLVLGLGPDGKPVQFTVTIDGMASGPNYGSGADAGGQGIVTGQCLYQLIRQKREHRRSPFEIRFLNPGVTA